MAYGKVHDAYWESERIEALSDRAALLGLFLMTGRHRNAIGCFKLGVGAITDEPRFGKWGIEGVSDALLELSESGFIIRDDRTGWTFITKTLEKDPVKGEKAAIHAAKLAEPVPVKTVVYKELYDHLSPVLQEELKGKKGVNGYPMASPIEWESNGDTIPKRSPSPLPSPLPEPEPKGFSSPPSDGDPPDDDLMEIPIPLDRTDVGEAIRLWNNFAAKHGLAQVQKTTAGRRSKLKARLADCGGDWPKVLEKIEAIPGMFGGHGGNGHENWRINFDWLVSEQNFTKLMEGAYDGWGTGGKDDSWAKVARELES